MTKRRGGRALMRYGIDRWAAVARGRPYIFDMREEAKEAAAELAEHDPDVKVIRVRIVEVPPRRRARRARG